MLRSKSGSGSVGHKNHSSLVFSRTLSASRLCRGDVIGTQIDASAYKSVEKKLNFSKSRIDRIMSMQQQMREMEDQLKTTKENLSVSLMEKSRVLDQIEEAVHEAKTTANQSLFPKKADELIMEVENLKKMLATTRDEMKSKDKNIDSLKVEHGKVRQIEAEKNASLNKLMNELIDVKEREKEAATLLSENKKRIQELEAEVEKKRKSESRMVDSLAVQNQQLDSAMFELEESRIEIASLHEKIDGLEDLCNQMSREDEIRDLKSELQSAKEKQVKAQEDEKKASLRTESLFQEMELAKKEWKLAVEGEEKSRKAMEDLALALKEVAAEANQGKEQLKITKDELERVKEEAKKMKEMMKTSEETYQNLLHEARHETEFHQKAADRLRLEAEESVLAWSGKEMGFVSCIKRADEERATAQHENKKLAESLQAAREEAYKLKDVLKQAISEANTAKAAARIARDENSLLKDCLAEKEEALHFITRENERLRTSEAAAHENMKQLKKMLTLASSELKMDDKDQNMILMFHDAVEEESESKKVTRAFSFDLEDLKFMNEPEDEVLDEDPEKAEALKGSIFDANAETPKSEVKTPKSAVFGQKMNTSAFSEDEGTTKPEDSDQINNTHDDAETDKHLHRRQKTMFQRVGGILTIGRIFYRKEPSLDQKTPSSQP